MWIKTVSGRRHKRRQQYKTNWALIGALPVWSHRLFHCHLSPLSVQTALMSVIQAGWSGDFQGCGMSERRQCQSLRCPSETEFIRPLHFLITVWASSHPHMNERSPTCEVMPIWATPERHFHSTFWWHLCTTLVDLWWREWMKQILYLCWFCFQYYSYLPNLYSELLNTQCINDTWVTVRVTVRVKCFLFCIYWILKYFISVVFESCYYYFNFINPSLLLNVLNNNAMI